MSQNAQNTIFREVGLVFESLTSLDSAYRVTALFRELGYELPGGIDFPNFPGLAARVEGIIQALIEFDQAADDAKTDALAELAQEIISLTQEIIALEQAVSTATAAFPAFVANAPLNELPSRLLDYLIIEYTRHYRQQVHAVMSILGIFETVELPTDGAIFQPETSLRKIFWNRLPTLISNPVVLFDDVYNWSTDFESDKFFTRVNTVLKAFLLPGGLYEQSPSLKSALGNTTDNLQELRFPILQNAVFPSTYSQFGIVLTSAEAQGPKKGGFAIVPYVFGAASFDFDLNETFEILFDTTASVDAGLGIVIRPGNIELMTNLFDAPTDAVNLNVELRLQQRENTGEIILFGASDATRLAIEGPAIKVFVSQGEGRDVGVEVKLDTLRLVVAGGEGDGFLSKILGDGGINAEAEFVLGYSVQQGFYFVGSGGLELQLATHITLGPLEIQGLIIALKIKDSNFDIDGGATFKVDIGPLVAVVDNIGVTTTLSFPDRGGNLGPANLAVGFKPPNGIGLSIDAQGIKGGGFLEIDRPNHRYAGILQLEIQETIDVTAIGLITTELPGGREGFSLLILISTEFQPIQLGMGFTLNGVGGLLGYNRTMVIDVLREGVRDSTLNSILFPEDPVANAMQIISDLRAAFPPHEGQFVIGPMAKIGYGTPSLITLELGLVIELPDPIRIAILGVLKAILPEEQSALIKIQVSFLGTIDFEAGKFTFDATIFDSRLLTFDLSGDMAVRLFWKGEPQFLLSVGGFHPSFEPPPLDLPTLRRMTLQILKGNNPRLRLETYFAVTSNTVQFGARLELYAGAGKFNVYGFLAFDVLFQFSPFYFIAGIGAMLALRIGSSSIASISLSLTLEGTTPWKAKGTAKLKLFWFLTIKVRFSKTWGQRRDTLLEDVAVLGRLVEALQNKSNWQATLPGQRNLLVSLKEIAPVEDQVVVHPFGGLTVSQKVVPLNVRIDKFGNAKPSDFNEFFITGHQAGGAPIHAADIATTKDYFAPAQFFKKSDAEKLSADSFVKYDAGFALGTSEQLESSYYVKREVEYELSYIDSQRAPRIAFFVGLIAPVAALFSLFAQNRAVARSPLSFAAKRKSALGPEAVQVNQEGYAVANVSDLSAAAGTTVVGSEAEAFALLDRLQGEQPALAGRLQVVPSFELNQELAA